MGATTIKLEGELLARLRKVKPPSMSISAYVRGLIEREVRAQSLAAAARQYQDFLDSAPAEREWLQEWTAIDLARPPSEKKR